MAWSPSMIARLGTEALQHPFISVAWFGAAAILLMVGPSSHSFACRRVPDDSMVATVMEMRVLHIPMNDDAWNWKGLARSAISIVRRGYRGGVSLRTERRIAN